MMGTRPKDWTQHRLAEPSTHTSFAVFILAVLIFVEMGTMEHVEWTKWLAIWGGFHALLGVVLKEGKGL